MMAILNKRLNRLSFFEGFRGDSWFSLDVSQVRGLANKIALNKIASIVLIIQGPVYSPLTYQTDVQTGQRLAVAASPNKTTCSIRIIIYTQAGEIKLRYFFNTLKNICCPINKIIRLE
jgi:hypothetical protein